MDAQRSNIAIARFVAAARAWQAPRPGRVNKFDPFTYAVAKVLRAAERLESNYQHQIALINVANVATDKDGLMRKDDKDSMIFKPAGARKRLEQIHQLNHKHVQIAVHIVQDFPSNLSPDQLYAFEGFVIPELADPAAPK